MNRDSLVNTAKFDLLYYSAYMPVAPPFLLDLRVDDDEVEAEDDLFFVLELTLLACAVGLTTLPAADLTPALSSILRSSLMAFEIIVYR